MYVVLFCVLLQQVHTSAFVQRVFSSCQGYKLSAGQMCSSQGLLGSEVSLTALPQALAQDIKHLNPVKSAL